jgi:cell division protein FtsN
VDAKQAVSSQARKRWALGRLIKLSLILLAIFVLGFIIFKQRQFISSKFSPTGPLMDTAPEGDSSGKNSSVFRAKMPPPPEKHTTKKPVKQRLERRQTKTVAPDRKSKKFRAESRSSKAGEARLGATRQTSPTKPAVTKKERENGATDKKPIPKKSPPQALTASKKSIAGKRARLTKPAAGVKKSSKVKIYDKLNDSKLKLQALAWSADTAKRMVVINGRIVREGESIDGYQINQIRQEDVIVNDGRQSWSLEFGLKQ